MNADIARCRAEQIAARDWLTANPGHPERAGAILGAQDWMAEEIMIEEEEKMGKRGYLKAAETKLATPSLFDILDLEAAAADDETEVRMTLEAAEPCAMINEANYG